MNNNTDCNQDREDGINMVVDVVIHNDDENGGISNNHGSGDASSGSIPSFVGNESLSKSPESPRPASCPPGPQTSTPISKDVRSHSEADLEKERSVTFTQTDLSISEWDHLSVPVVGYEIVEQRNRFTVFKLHVQTSTKDNWFVFRRYTDFVRLNHQLKCLFPGFRLALPPKKWFGNNFDCEFLEDRQLGLQAFVTNVTGHKDIVKSQPVREFLCLDDPPGPHDSLEESRALCENLEDTLHSLKVDLAEKEKMIERLQEENATLRDENDHLQRTLRGENGASSCRRSSPPPESESSLAECEYPSAAEADQIQQNGDSEKSRAFRSLSTELEQDLSMVHLEQITALYSSSYKD
ncbi:uncharacterized protein LOC144437110 isoform X2 [Glandiceps talaboti]